MNRVTVLLLVALLPARALAQSDRFEVGQRLRAFETAWEEHKDEAARKRALAALEKVTVLFFKGSLDEVARTFDQARHLLTTAKEPSATVRWAGALAVRPAARFLDNKHPELSITVASFYKVEAELPKDAILKLTLRDANGKALAEQQTPITALPLQTKPSLDGVHIPEGDHTLEAVIVVGKTTVTAPAQTISFAEKLADRLAALKKAAADLPAKPAVERETLRGRIELLEALADRATHEANFAAFRALTEAESVLKAIRAGKTYYGERKPGQLWLRLPVGPKGTVVRLLAPEAVREGKPLPLVVALHGAGGGENLFFEGYGRGEIVRQCQQRGWLLVAPRTEGFTFNGPIPDIIEEINRLYPVDRKRVFLVGHSMGAMQAVSAAQQTPERFAAVAALAGGGAVKKSDGIKGLPFFVAVGSKDFMAGMVRNLKDSLAKAGAERVVFREYPDVEHIVIVRQALPEVFAFFDKALKR